MGVLSEKEITRGGFVPKAVSNPQRSVVIKNVRKYPVSTNQNASLLILPVLSERR
jgi:hypothetical protein